RYPPTGPIRHVVRALTDQAPRASMNLSILANKSWPSAALGCWQHCGIPICRDGLHRVGQTLIAEVSSRRFGKSVDLCGGVHSYRWCVLVIAKPNLHLLAV